VSKSTNDAFADWKLTHLRPPTKHFLTLHHAETYKFDDETYTS